MPYLDSNIPSKIFYPVFGTEILRLTITTNDANIFRRYSKILISRMMKQGDCQPSLINCLTVTLIYFTSRITLPLHLLNHF